MIALQLVEYLIQQAPTPPASGTPSGDGSLPSLFISGLFGGGGVALIVAIYKGWGEIKKLRQEENKAKAENSKVIEEATSSVVELLNKELLNQSTRFVENVKWLEDQNRIALSRNTELTSANHTLEITNDRLERQVDGLQQWSTRVEYLLRQNGITPPPLEEYLEGR